MFELDLSIPSALDDESIPRLIEEVCALEGLSLSLKGTLAKYPGCIHWHYRKGKARGTLEITWWETKRRLWIKVAAARSADWMEVTIPRLKQRIEKYN